MKCPHCLEGFHDTWEARGEIAKDKDGSWRIVSTKCPACKRAVIKLLCVIPGPKIPGCSNVFFSGIVYPRSPSRMPLSEHIPERFAQDYREACQVLADSAKASAALSRSCLQNILREKANIKQGKLYDEIEQVLNSKQLPTYVADPLHDVRVVGNFAAHPIKSEKTGEVLDVEPGEAEANLDALEALLDHYFVKPKEQEDRRKKLNEKLKEAGKEPLT